MLTVDPATRDFVDLTDGKRTGLSHLPGLDGLRGLAVVVVLAFHAGYERMVGGYLGVSTFFTLSGFLITSLLLLESRRTGTVALRSFWGRRFRRLMPASLALLAGVVLLFGPLVATADQRATMQGDVLSSLFDVANWHFILSGSSYADLFTSPSPVLHFWSLAIEEQFYVLFPIILVGLWAVTKGRRGLLAAGLGALALASFIEPFVFSMSDDRIYFGTDTRAVELLLGAMLAVALSSERFRRRLAMRYHWRSTVIVAGVVAFVVQAWWWWQLPQSTSWLYQGGFALYAVLSCAVITATALPSGPLRAVMSVGALRWLGARSYGIYLIHWPIFLAVRQTWPDLDRTVSTVIAVSVTMGLAILSYRFLERPVRAGRWPAKGRAIPAAALSMALVAAAVVFVPLPVKAGERTVDFNEALASYKQLGKRPSATTTTVPTAVPVPGIAFYGDSTALLAAMGFGPWGEKSGKARFVDGEPVLGCGVSRFTAIQANQLLIPTASCRDWPNRWATKLQATMPDVVILMSSVWEVADSRIPGSKKFEPIGTPAVDAFVKSEFLAAVDVLASKGALVVLPTAPIQGSWAADGKTEGAKRQALPERTVRLNQLLAEVAAERPDTVRLVDFAGWLGDRSQDRNLRQDGIHIKGAEFEQVSAEWFGPAVINAWEEWWRTHREPLTTTTTSTPVTAPPAEKSASGR
jgi:peptidoglycan/LPS O-acetylase OafA/YrhL